MSSPQPASLRDLYAPPPTTWSFTPPTNGSQAAVPTTSTPSYQWSTHSSQGSIFGLGPSGYDESGTEIGPLLRGATNFLIGQFSSTMVAIPWEIGKVLLQVQWVPRDTEVPEDDEDVGPLEEHNEDDAVCLPVLLCMF